MAEFNAAFDRTMLNEGGYKLTSVANDKGRQTYAGLSRRANPDWNGWLGIDAGKSPTVDQVRAIYRANYWTPLKADQITNQSIASSLYDFAVNAGVNTAVKLAQIVANVVPDGVVGPKTLAAFNNIEPNLFRLAFSMAKIARYEAIVSKDRSQDKFLLGWVRRVLKDAE